MNLNHPYYIEPRTGKMHLDLCGQWDYTYCDGEVKELVELNWNMQTRIPNSVYWSLYESGVLPHPYEECNSKKYHWVDEKVWYYRKSFTLSEESNSGNAYLCIDGAAYYSRVWVNGTCLGEHEGMFGGPIVDIAEHLDFNGENEIIIEIKSCNYGKKEDYHSRNHEGINREIVPWNIARDAETSTGDFIVLGLWNRVRIEFLPEIHINRPYLVTQSIENNQAKLHLELEIAMKSVSETIPFYGIEKNCYSYTRAYDKGLTGAVKEESVQINIAFSEKSTGKVVYEHTEEVKLQDYENSLINESFYECQFYCKDIVIENPSLWYPHDMGNPFLYAITISLIKDGNLLDEQTFDYGIRIFTAKRSAGNKYKTRWENFQFSVNGKNIFLKGMNWMPVDYLYKIDADEYLWALQLVKKASIQLLRVWSGGGFPETDDFYKLCDELGIMVWQDHFIANTNNTQGWPQDVLEAQEAMNLYRIRNHSSLVIHCGGNEFNPYSEGNAASMFVIDRTIRTLDPSRIFHYTTADKGSAHIYRDMEPVWYRHQYKQLPFIGETGIHSFPNFKSLRQLINKEECIGKLPDLSSTEFAEQFPQLINHFTEYVPSRVPRMTEEHLKSVILIISIWKESVRQHKLHPANFIR